MTLNIIYFSGGPRERVLQRLIDDGHSIDLVVFNDPDRWPKVYPTINLARSLGLPTVIVKNKSEIAGISEHIVGKVCLSAGFNYILPGWFIELAQDFLNIHGTLLPKYRGMSLPWAIELGERESGVSVHFMDEGADTGDLILQKSYPLSPFETYRSLQRKMHEFEPSVVSEALKLYESGGRSVAYPQPQLEGRQLPDRRPTDGEVDPTKSLADLFDKIRSSDPNSFPAYFFHNGEKVCIKLWRPDKPPEDFDLV